MSRQRKITIGVGVVVPDPKTKSILVSRRLKKAGKDSLALPGGHIEEGETLVAAATRETFEETGLIVRPRELHGHTYVLHADEWFREDKHTWTVYVVGDIVGGTLENREPEKHENWRWEELWKLEEIVTEKDWLPMRALIYRMETIFNLDGGYC